MSYASKMIGKEIKLKPVDSRKSFYGKAKVIDADGKEYLQSYDTIVAEYDKKTGKVKVHGWYSPTTARHIDSFLERHGKKRLSKKEIGLGVTL